MTVTHSRLIALIKSCKLENPVPKKASKENAGEKMQNFVTVANHTQKPKPTPPETKLTFTPKPQASTETPIPNLGTPVTPRWPLLRPQPLGLDPEVFRADTLNPLLQLADRPLSHLFPTASPRTRRSGAQNWECESGCVKLGAPPIPGFWFVIFVVVGGGFGEVKKSSWAQGADFFWEGV